MNKDNCELACGLVSRSYISQGQQAIARRQKLVKTLLSSRRCVCMVGVIVLLWSLFSPLLDLIVLKILCRNLCTLSLLAAGSLSEGGMKLQSRC